MLAIGVLVLQFLGILAPASITCAESLHCCCAPDELVSTQSSECCQQEPFETKHASCDNSCSHGTPEFYSQASQSSASSINFFELRRFHTAKNCRGYSEKRLRPAPKIKSPPVCRAYNQLKSAVRALPIWKKPVGLGAKRTRTFDMIGRNDD